MTKTDFLDDNIVQQEPNLVANCADDNDRRRITGYEITHVFLPLARRRHLLLDNKRRVKSRKSHHTMYHVTYSMTIFNDTLRGLHNVLVFRRFL